MVRSSRFGSWAVGLAVLGFIHSQALLGRSELAPELTESAAARIQELLTPPFTGANFEALEKEYQRLVQPQTLADLRKIYDPANRSKLKFAYATFTPEEGLPGHDRGYGFHVVKRLELPLSGKRTKVIDVNEQWPSHRGNGGLFLPDEIRIKTLVFEGDRRIEGSEKLYLFDSIRLAWGPAGEVSIHRRTRYEWNPETGTDRRRVMRAPVSAPISCIGCHNSPTTFAPHFLSEGESVNHEAIVQDSYFARPVTESFGFKKYLMHLKGLAPSNGEFVKAAERELKEPARSFQVPGLYEELGRVLAHPSFSWLGDDGDTYYGVSPEVAMMRQGVYRRGQYLLVDAIEEIFEGKYRWWEPTVVLPVSSHRYR